MRHNLVVIVILLPLAAAAARDPSDHGPYAVGFTRRTYTKPSETTGQPRALDTYIWYPAVAGTGSPDGAVLPDAQVARRRSPLVVFSHGSCGFPGQSPFLTETLASWGFVVAAPPHPGNTTFELTTCEADAADSFANRVADVRFVIDSLLAASAPGDPLLAHRVDRRRIGVIGHSFGGQTALRVLAADRRVRAGVGLAPASIVGLGLLITRPAMVMTGEIDSMTPFEQEARGTYDELRGRRLLVELLDAGHCAFTIACLPEFCGVGCEPGALSLADAHRVTLRWTVPFLLRYVAQKPAFGKLLRAGPGDSGVVVESGRRSTRAAP
jgi:predicted dienelactone hydrolase